VVFNRRLKKVKKSNFLSSKIEKIFYNISREGSVYYADLLFYKT